jgi:hypothetical protein
MAAESILTGSLENGEQFRLAKGKGFWKEHEREIKARGRPHQLPHARPKNL